MADIRCPMCGKMNPADTEICQFCQARLTPLVEHPGQAALPEPVDAGEAGIPDWLNSLRGKEQSDTSFNEPEAVEPSSTVPEGEDIPDWLSRIRDRNQPEDNSLDTSSELNQTGDLPAWLSAENVSEKPETVSPEAGPPAAEGEIQEEGEEPEWLVRLRSRQQSEETDVHDETHETDLPDWLKSSDEKPPIDSPFSQGGDERLPDWLQNISDTPPSPTSLPEEESAPAWLDSLSNASPTSGGNIGTFSDETEPPDWLKQFTAQTNEELPPETISDFPPEESSTDWSLTAASMSGSDLNSTIDVQKPEEALPEVPAFGDMPEWLSDLKPTEPAEVPSAVQEEKLPLSPFVPEALPVGDMGLDSSLPPGEDVFSSEIPEWLEGLQSTSAVGSSVELEGQEPKATQEEPVIEPFVPGELPEWLSRLGPPVEGVDRVPPFAVAQDAAAPGEDAALMPAELPAWVKALRPVEAVTPQSAVPSSAQEQTFEKTGPLAGLSGVLTTDGTAIEIGKSAVVSTRLQVSENQRMRTALLESLLASSTEPRPVPSDALFTPQRVFRAMMGLILIVVMLVPLLLQTQIIAFPELFSTQLVAFQQSIDTLPPNAPVLLVFDYEPGLSGEMEAAAGKVVDQLMAKGAELTLFSTTATGPVMAEKLMSQVISQNLPYQTAYNSQEKVLNLGYLPGGQAALQDFALLPQRSSPYTLDGKSAWSLPPLQNVKQLTDFARVIVITENPDLAQSWVEQVGPYLGTTPLLMVVSAQASPMLLPYYDSGQIQGMVAGLTGAAAYEQLLQQSQAVRPIWDAYHAGLLVAILLIIGGIVLNFGRITFARKKTR